MVNLNCGECEEEATVLTHPGKYCAKHNPYSQINIKIREETKKQLDAEVKKVTGGILKEHYDRYYKLKESEVKKEKEKKDEHERRNFLHGK